jgi:hypothetical protein
VAVAQAVLYTKEHFLLPAELVYRYQLVVALVTQAPVMVQQALMEATLRLVR